MNYKIILLPSAQKEIIEIKNWYHQKREGLDVMFVKELKENIQLVDQNPMLF